MAKYSLNKAARYAKTYGRSLSGRLNIIYRKQIVRSRERNFPPPAYSFKQLKKKYINNPLYLKIHAEWVASNYNKQLVPSIDRKESSKPYTLRNIQMMTWAQNRMKQATTDIHNSHDTPVAAIVGLHIVSIYDSQKEAKKQTGASNIRACLQNDRLTSNGYVWKSLYGMSKQAISRLKLRLPVAYSTVKFTPKEHRKRGVYKTVRKLY